MITKSNETRRVDQKSTWPTRSSIFSIIETFLPSATKLRRLCFYRHLSVHRGEGVSASMHGGIPHPPEQTPPRADTQEQTPPWSRQPPGADTPPKQTPPLEQTTPWSRHPPQSRPLPRADPPEQTHPPAEQTSRSRPPQEQTPQSRHPPRRADTPQSRHPPEQTPPPPEIRPLLRTVRILLECILVCFVMVRWGESKCVNSKTSASQRHYETFWGRG